MHADFVWAIRRDDCDASGPYFDNVFGTIFTGHRKALTLFHQIERNRPNEDPVLIYVSYKINILRAHARCANTGEGNQQNTCDQDEQKDCIFFVGRELFHEKILFSSDL